MEFAKSAACHYLLITLWLFSSAMNQRIPNTSATFDDYVRILNDVILPYNHRVRPLTNQSKAIEVNLTFNLDSLIKIDDIHQEIHLNAWVNISWYDEIRAWKPSDYGGINVIHLEPLDLWRPRTVVSNSIGKRDLFGDDYTPIHIFSTGVTRWYPGTNFILSCDLDMTYFPFDRQRCQVMFLAFNNGQLILTFAKNAVSFNYFTCHGEWDFLSYSTEEELLTTGGESANKLIIYLVFERRPKFYIINFLVPVMFISFLSFFVFVIPEDSGERISFVITALVSLAVYMTTLSGHIPHTSDSFPIIVVYILFLLLLSDVTVIVTAIQMRLIRGRLKINASCMDASLNNVKHCEISKSPSKTTPKEKHFALYESNFEDIVEAGPSNATVLDRILQCKGETVKPAQKNSGEAMDPKGNGSQPKVWENVLMKDFQLFLGFVTVWVILTIYFICKLIYR